MRRYRIHHSFRMLPREIKRVYNQSSFLCEIRPQPSPPLILSNRIPGFTWLSCSGAHDISQTTSPVVRHNSPSAHPPKHHSSSPSFWKSRCCSRTSSQFTIDRHHAPLPYFYMFSTNSTAASCCSSIVCLVQSSKSAFSLPVQNSQYGTTLSTLSQ